MTSREYCDTPREERERIIGFLEELGNMYDRVEVLKPRAKYYKEAATLISMMVHWGSVRPGPLVR